MKLDFLLGAASAFRSMPSPSRRHVALLPVILILGLMFAAVGPGSDAHASTQEAPPAEAPVEAELSVATVQTRIDALNAEPDLDTAVRARALELYEQSTKSLEAAAAAKTQAEQYVADKGTAPARLEAARQTLAAPAPETPAVADDAALLRVTEIEAQVTAAETALAATRAKLQETQDRLAREQSRPEEIQRVLTEAGQRLEQIEAELASAAPADEPSVVTQARRTALLARQLMRRAEIAAAQAELAGREMRIEILSAARDIGLREVAQREARLTAWQQELQARLAAEARQAATEAAAAELTVQDLPQSVRDLARENTAIAEELTALRERQTAITTSVEAARTKLGDLKTDFANIRQRAELAGLNETIGLVLRKQRADLPNLRGYRRAAHERIKEMGDLTGRQLENDLRRRRLTDLDARLADIVAALDPSLPERIRAEAEERAAELLQQKQGLVRDLSRDYGRQIRLLGDLDNAERELVAGANEYRDFINEHLLWVRSTSELGHGTLAETRRATAWITDAGRWRGVAEDIGTTWKDDPVVWIALGLGAIVVLFGRRRARRDLGAIASKVGKIRTDSLGLTLRAVADSTFIAVGWPLIALLAGWRLASLAEVTVLTSALGVAVMDAAVLWALLAAAAVVLRKQGLADVHFEWSEKLRTALRRHLPWLTITLVPLSIPVAAWGRLGVEDFTGSFARFAFLGIMACTTVSLLLVLRPGGTVMTAFVRRAPNGWLTRLRFVWGVLLVAIPVALAALAAAGFFYTAVHLSVRLESMLGAGLVLLVAHQTLMRGVHVTQRRLAWEEAKRKRLELRAAKLDDGAASPPSGEFDAILVQENELQLAAITSETRGFIRTLTGIAAAILLWTVWADALPALGMLERVELWPTSAVVDGVTKTVPVTLAGVTLSALVILMTILAAKNLPGALEISILKRLPLDAGARYAFTTICTYVIIGVGIIVAFNMLGVRWTSLQWLVAALGVGLGFGLQEIVANFVSGIIILFERPFRIGDIVTVGDLNGKVAKIRIRATTIVDWDRRELVVPNKRFITGELINSTLSNLMTRIRIPVGLAYGTNIAAARDVLLDVARSHELVLDDPAPAALFLGFGDSALSIELRVFLANINDKLTVTDQLHERIATAFERAGIEIVFPQRDVNLKTAQPVELILVDRNGTAPGAKSLMSEPVSS